MIQTKQECRTQRRCRPEEGLVSLSCSLAFNHLQKRTRKQTKARSTYFQKQWAAVSSHVLLMSVAPHWWPAPMSCRLACHGHSPSIAVSLPWTIRSVVEDAGNGMFEDDILIPHPEKETYSSLFSWQQRKVSWLVFKEVTEKILCSVTL